MPTELPKQFDPKLAQERCLTFWQQHNFNHSRPDPNRKPFTIVIPPPNVTGALHMGHALNNTLQDVLIRWRRMQGFNAEWMPGTDHAGIATQAVVERLIYSQEKKTRHDLGREELVRRIWEYKDKYEARILGQLRQLGCSCDWDRTRFTFDAEYNRAVRTTFFNWFRDGFIFRGKRLVNWDTQLQTSVADDETYDEVVKGGFWTFHYPVKPAGERSEPAGSQEFIRFSTTRPETMLGDTAVAVHPDDPRYKHLIGKTVTIPLNGREIPIIADKDLVDPKLGTGCVKVTPAHDPNDYACGQRHKLPMINILNPDGTINENGAPFQGLDRYKAREAVTAKMEELGYFDGREDRDIPMKFSDRSKTPIEPYLSDQWFVKMGDIESRERERPDAGFARRAMDAVENGKVRFVPERYKNSYLDWLAEKRDWCISRQLWWGHRIPVWRKPYEGEMLSADEEMIQTSTSGELRVDGKQLGYEDPAYRDKVAHKTVFDTDRKAWMNLVCIAPGADKVEEQLESDGYVKDPDVLDTWFSSQLWPHATFGWPEQTPELAYYYPTSVLVTTRDIITLWVVRMVISGLYNMGDVPFHDVYITPKLLDGFGVTMSKSKGNGVDPLDIIELYGTDALRYHMVFLAGETQDCRLPVSNVCPFCGHFAPATRQNSDPDIDKRPKKMTCPNPECKKQYRPGGPWPMDDPKLPTAKQASKEFEVGRNLGNKLWNSARFLLLNLDGYQPEIITNPGCPVGAMSGDPAHGGIGGLSDLPIEDLWILSRLQATTKAVTESLEQFHFSDVARTLYDFFWSEFCDWYVEMSKGRLKDEDARPLAQRMLVGVLDAILRLMHPVMPFVTETIWQAMNEAAFERGLPAPEPSAESVMIAQWPEFPESWHNADVEARIGRMQALIRGIREIRNQFMVDDKTTVEVFVKCSQGIANDFQTLQPFIAQLAMVKDLTCGPNTAKPPQAASKVTEDFALYVSLAGLIDVAKERGRLEKQLAEKQKFLAAAEAKLNDEKFVSKAPPEVVQEKRDQMAELKKQIAALEENLRELQ
ncbi:MAG TPA: valine--tRNA ligase [Gemmataceae bacterium]|nr:valine--tRNA ligase [Gemmataceae bacterium]